MLFVYAKGGPPLSYAIARISAHATVHILALAPMPSPDREAWEPHCASVVHVPPGTEDDVVRLIADRAGAVGADAVMTLSEFAVIAVAEACEKLGLPGAGGGAVAARDKRAMRAAWQAAGVPVPGFVPVHDEADMRAAVDRLDLPVLLKSAWSVGSIAHQVITSEADAVEAWARSVGVIEDSARAGLEELRVPQARGHFLVEELVAGSADDWYGPESGWGDYVSVEGIVADGRYHPLCITGKLPTIPPFTERASISPTTLPEPAQRRIEELSRAAVNALGLSTCATHTEIKLGPRGQMWVIETAARFGGAMTVPQVESVFGIDMIGMLTRQLLGRTVGYPPRMLTEGHGATASLLIHPVHPDGTPWTPLPVWDFDAVPWHTLLSPGGHIEVVPELSRPNGTPTVPYDAAGGSTSMAALCLVSGADATSVADDCHRIVEALPRLLPLGRGVREETTR
ncbi:ATP-grasp domain-containing protein [Streptomyces sp. TRM64462]|uniref:ATP-grasp domain-containing protein n=1 Tax=Streptomyces sp. TRM64462 TaxID=2741726 RepID=UPI0028149936|nr:ATP-grasp domain-containing protein [Streptomyces sp. TRM64462]